MTLPNIITLFRFLLVPVFVGALLYYHRSFREGAPVDAYWMIALGSFVTASVSDALDGFIARRFNLRSHLGAILDPLADKALLVSALVVLGWIDTDLAQLPLWFVVLVLGRDLFLVMGTVVLQVYVSDFKVKPHWAGKVATALMMVAVSMVLLKFDSTWVDPVVYLGGLFTLVSLVVYLVTGLRALAGSDVGSPPRR